MKARALFSSILDSPSNKAVADVMSFWASLEARSNNITTAREKLRMGLKKHPSHISSLVTLASLEARAGAHQGAIHF